MSRPVLGTRHSVWNPRRVAIQTKPLHVAGAEKHRTVRDVYATDTIRQLFRFEEGMYPERYEPGMAPQPTMQRLRFSFPEAMTEALVQTVTEDVLFLVLYYDSIMFESAYSATWDPYKASRGDLVELIVGRHPGYSSLRHMPAFVWMCEKIRNKLAKSRRERVVPEHKSRENGDERWQAVLYYRVPALCHESARRHYGVDSKLHGGRILNSPPTERRAQFNARREARRRGRPWPCPAVESLTPS